MSSTTLGSRILGMIRDIVSARQFGTSWQWDAFIYAFMFPNFFRRIVGEGALSSAFVPVYSEILAKEGAAAAQRFANTIATLLATFLLGVLVFVEAGLALSLNAGILGERLTLTFQLLQTLFPYLWFISLYAVCMGILNCHKHFFVPSLAPVILNLSWIAGVLWISPLWGSADVGQIRILSYCILTAGFLQLLMQLPMLARVGFKPQWLWQTAHPGIRKVIRLLLPAILSFAIVQVNLLVDMTLAFWIGPGASSSLWYGNRMMQFPLGIFTIAMGTALLPTISEQVAKKDLEVAKQTMLFAMRCVFLIILPCTVGLMVMSQPLTQLLFERGAFDGASTARTSFVLLCYAFGLFGFSGLKMVTAGFHAVQDAKTPVKVGAWALITNLILNLILMQFFKEAGLALATSITGILQCLLLIFYYDQRIVSFPFLEMLKSFLKIALAASLMGLYTYASYHGLLALFPGSGLVAQLLQTGLCVTSSIAVYFVTCLVFRISEMKQVWQWLKTRK